MITMEDDNNNDNDNDDAVSFLILVLARLAIPSSNTTAVVANVCGHKEIDSKNDNDENNMDGTSSLICVVVAESNNARCCSAATHFKHQQLVDNF